MTPLRRLHDKLVQTQGTECTCDTKGPASCPAWHAATKHQHRRDNPQLQLGHPTPPGAPMQNDDWGGY